MTSQKEWEFLLDLKRLMVEYDIDEIRGGYGGDVHVTSEGLTHVFDVGTLEAIDADVNARIDAWVKEEQL
ncbi:hypothetical protein PMW_197 [Pseudomonas phage phiPMW]|uniref:Uncharacterized protein n=1 Tax=Pseudomonas phage phiPMW TaxID=1815582 RepID=A0A1S5R1L4_9CAUD|nr:hypothetical protein FDG97_gp153 [Pseudomonas phage phiPMW]ANA49322.1 hypothetical protein PMW_197 [Pseudomonas phage phiPMW]